MNHVLCNNISNARGSVSSGDPNTKKRVEIMTHSGVFFDKIQDVWIANETLYQIYDMSSQSKQKLRGK